MNRLKKHASTLKLLHKAKTSLRKAIISKGHDELIRCICKCTLNILHDHAPISQKHKNQLSRHKMCLRKLVDRKISLKQKKVIQNGGLLGALLSAVIPTVASLIGGLASKQEN